MEAIKAIRVAGQPIYNYWQGFLFAFFSNRLYVDVAKRWKGYGFSYILLLIAIMSIPFTAMTILRFNHYFDEEVVYPIEQLPEFYIQNGKVLFDKPMPYEIKDQRGQVVIIIDTTGKVNAISNDYPNLFILINKTSIQFRTPKLQPFNPVATQTKSEEIYQQRFSESDNEVFHGKTWLESSNVMTMKYVAELLVYPVVTSIIFIISLIILQLLVLLAQVASQVIFKMKFKYKEASRLFMVASTPQIIITLLMTGFSINFAGEGLVHTVLIAVYYSFAILSVRRESKKLVSL